MSRPVAVFRMNGGGVAVGQQPRVVGTLSSLAWTGPLAGDIIEVRYDRLDEATDWLKRCAALQDRGKPVLLTARLASEGGAWKEDDRRRLELYASALGQLAAVDVELSSSICAEVAVEAKKREKICIVSYHNFQCTPEVQDLRVIARRAQALGSVIKISTMLHSERDAGTLRTLLADSWECPICVIGMGVNWSGTRLSFARLGSCLTYGYLDQPAAPGQVSAAELSQRLREHED